MPEVTRLLNALAGGEPHAAGELLLLVYDELRRLAAQKLAQESAGQTLQATALVHEAYLRLVASPAREGGEPPHWNGKGHFFAAAAQAMRRILVENARRKGRARHGGGRRREHPDLETLAAGDSDEQLLALHAALEQFAAREPVMARLVELRFFAGLTLEQAAGCLGIPLSTAARGWRYARAWLYAAMSGDEPEKK